MFCPQCGANNTPGAAHCASCGALLAPAAQPGAAPYPATAPGDVPQEIKGFNFGAFALNWIWAFAHRLWLWGILILVTSCTGFIPLGIAIYLGVKGNELAWKARPFTSVQQFKETQRVWTIAGIMATGLFVILIPIMAILAAVAIPNFLRAKERAQGNACTSQLSFISTAIQDYIVENGSLEGIMSVDDVCMHMIPGAASAADCAGQITERVDKACKPGTLKFTKDAAAFTYEIEADTLSGCHVCATESGMSPEGTNGCPGTCRH